MKKAIAITLLVASTGANACLYVGEVTNGMNKICYYDCVNGRRAITIGALDLCPLSLYRDLRRIIGLPSRCGITPPLRD